MVLCLLRKQPLLRELGSNSTSADSTNWACRQRWARRGFDFFPWVRKLCKNWENALRAGNLSRQAWACQLWGTTEGVGEGKSIILWERLTQEDLHHRQFPVGIWHSDTTTRPSFIVLWQHPPETWPPRSSVHAAETPTIPLPQTPSQPPVKSKSSNLVGTRPDAKTLSGPHVAHPPPAEIPSDFFQLLRNNFCLK